MLMRVKTILDANIDYGGAVVSATALGLIVFWLNRQHGAALASSAALKQATYTFFAAGFILKNNLRLALKWADRPTGVLRAASVSSAIAIGLTFLVHSVKGTAEPLLSTLPTALLGPPTFLLVAWRASRRGVGGAD